MTGPGTTATVLDILRAGDCSPSCLLSSDTGRCSCRCGGAHHGELLADLAAQAGSNGQTASGSRETAHE